MGYITVESGHYTARVHITEHTQLFKPEVLQPTSTALALEATSLNTQMIMQVLLQKNSGHLQYDEAINYARSRGKPLLAAEPIYKDTFWSQVKPYSTRDKLVMSVLEVYADNAFKGLINMEGEIPESDPRLQTIRRYADLSSSWVRFCRFSNGFRNDAMAQRIDAFAQLQRSSGIQAPAVDLITGGAHIRVVDSLRKTPEQRTQDLLNNPDNVHIGAENLATVHYFTYNPNRRKWLPRKFQEPLLKVKV